jgi:uncharacterized membrane protein YkoI
MISREDALGIAKEKYNIYQVYSIELMNINNKPVYEIKGRTKFLGFLPIKITETIDANKTP